MDDDLPGLLSFSTEEVHIQEATVQQTLQVPVRRKMGASGQEDLESQKRCEEKLPARCEPRIGLWGPLAFGDSRS